MKRLLQFLFSGCFHVWKEDARHKYFGNGDDTSKLPTGYVVYCTCTKCGTPRRWILG